MAEKTKCEICSRTFKNAEGLTQHNQAKHSSPAKEVKKNKSSGKMITFLILGIIAVLIIWSIFSAVSESNSCKTAPAEEINIGGHTNLALHIHQDLRIIINGQQQQIPSNIGILPGIMRPIHTHDVPGELHVEGPCRRDFVLGDFFKIWGREFNSQCIFNYCTDRGSLKFYVNGIESTEFENYVLKDQDNLLIEYSSYS